MIQQRKVYADQLSRILSDFIKKNRDWMSLGNIDLSSVIAYYLEQRFCKLQPNRDLVNEDIVWYRSRIDLLIRILDLFKPLASDNRALGVQVHAWDDILYEYKGSIIVFARDSLRIVDCQNELVKLVGNVLIISYDDLPENVSFPNNFFHIEMESTDIMRYINTYMMRCFSSIFEIANAFSWILSIISPPEIILLETDSIESKVMRSVATGLSINVKCRH